MSEGFGFLLPDHYIYFLPVLSRLESMQTVKYPCVFFRKTSEVGRDKIFIWGDHYHQWAFQYLKISFPLTRAWSGGNHVPCWPRLASIIWPKGLVIPQANEMWFSHQAYSRCSFSVILTWCLHGGLNETSKSAGEMLKESLISKRNRILALFFCWNHFMFARYLRYVKPSYDNFVRPSASHADIVNYHIRPC